MPIEQPPAIVIQEPALPKGDAWTMPVSQALTIASFQPTNLIITYGTGSVSISMKDGSVSFHNCEVDDAAKAFWKAVEHFAPTKERK